MTELQPHPEDAQQVDADSLLSSHRASKLLQVNPSSINNWIDEGRLPAFRTPGGHRRIRARDLVGFLRAHGMPIPPSLRHAGAARLLWVDDDERFLRSVRRHMTKHAERIDVRFLTSGIDALLEVGSFRPDLIVLDVVMPDLDGIEVCERLRARADTREVGVLYVSAQSDGDTRRRALAAGARGFLVKPVRVDEVLAHLGLASFAQGAR